MNKSILVATLLLFGSVVSYGQSPNGAYSSPPIGGSGTAVATVAGSSPITSTGTTAITIACPTCTTSAAPLGSGNVVTGAGGQAVQDSGIVGTQLLTSASALTNNAVVLGQGSQVLKTATFITTNGTSQLNVGIIGGGNGVLALGGNTSGQATITAPAVAGTASNNIVFSNGISVPAAGNFGMTGRSQISSSSDGTIQLANNGFTAFSRLNFFSDNSANPALCVNGTGLKLGAGAAQCTTLTNLQLGSVSLTNLLISSTAPTIAAGGCGGSAASISANNGTASFNINVGTGPTSAGCTVTLPTATTGWNCSVNDFTTISTAVSMQKQTASSTASATFQNYSDLTVATAPTANDIYHVSCFAN